VTTLVSSGAYAILEHYESVVVYASTPAEQHLMAVSTTGGAAVDLGPCALVPSTRHILDERDDSLLIRDATGAIRLLDTITEPAMLLTKPGISARFLPDKRVILQQADGVLVVHDGDGSTPLEPHARGPFGLEPAWGRWYVTAIDEADKGDETSLVVDIVP
jgi:hypothetical protein